MILHLILTKEEDSTFLVSEPQFHLHAIGSSRLAALVGFFSMLSEELEDLTLDETILSSCLLHELAWLRQLRDAGFIDELPKDEHGATLIKRDDDADFAVGVEFNLTTGQSAKPPYWWDGSIPDQTFEKGGTP